MSDANGDPRIGAVIEQRYRVLERIASGGMGVVYRAERLQIGRVVAIKFLHSMFAGHGEFLRRFEKEARLMSRLEHPHCVSVIDFGVADSPFIVMDFVTGPTLRDVVGDDAEPLAPSRAIRIARQVLAGLAHAHDRGIVHRDIKPANIVLASATGTGDHARILDFGLARLRDADMSTTGAMIVGTPSYMSPEQAAGMPTDGRADIYATALVLFELLTGDRAFYADEAHEVLRMHREQPPPALAEIAESVAFSAELEAVVRRALAKRPEDRYQTPTAFSEALGAVPEVGTDAGQALSAGAPPRRWPRRLAFAAVVAGAAWLFWDRGWEREVKAGLGSAADHIRTLSSADEAAAPEPASPPPSLDGARALVASGDSEAAIAMLHELRRGDPQDARVSLLLGELYFDKGWRAEALAAYDEALARDPDLAGEQVLVSHVIRSLDDGATRNKARAIVLKRMGDRAVPALRRAASRAREPARGEARRLLRELEQYRSSAD